MLDLRDKFLLKCLVASGGRQAVKQARSDDVKVVVAVACEKELVDGIRAIFPKPVIAVINSRPNGPCKDTKIDAAKVREAIEGIVEGRAEG